MIGEGIDQGGLNQMDGGELEVMVSSAQMSTSSLGPPVALGLGEEPVRSRCGRLYEKDAAFGDVLVYWYSDVIERAKKVLTADRANAGTGRTGLNRFHGG